MIYEAWVLLRPHRTCTHNVPSTGTLHGTSKYELGARITNRIFLYGFCYNQELTQYIFKLDAEQRFKALLR